jgi:hypothetical protein
VQKLKQQYKTLLRENNSLKLELESKSASNETHYRRSPLEGDSESRIRELEKSEKALKKVKHSPNIAIIIVAEISFLLD